MNKLSNWIFNYNEYTKKWRGVKRDESIYLFSKHESNFLCSDSIDCLIELVIKTDGDKEKIQELIDKGLILLEDDKSISIKN